MSKTSAERSTKPKIRTETCLECNEEIGAGLSHCEGSKLAYGCLTLQPHHGKTLWPRCWKCGGSLGCSLCVPGGFIERESSRWSNPDLICKRCRVKATLESLLNGGPISKFFMRQAGETLEWGQSDRHTPDLGEYPKAWVSAYAIQRVNSGLSSDENDEKAMRECRAAFEHFRIAEISKPKGRRALQRERNKQVAAVVEISQPAAEPSLEITDDDLPQGCWDDERAQESQSEGRP